MCRVPASIGHRGAMMDSAVFTLRLLISWEAKSEAKFFETPDIRVRHWIYFLVI